MAQHHIRASFHSSRFFASSAPVISLVFSSPFLCSTLFVLVAVCFMLFCFFFVIGDVVVCVYFRPLFLSKELNTTPKFERKDTDIGRTREETTQKKAVLNQRIKKNHLKIHILKHVQKTYKKHIRKHVEKHTKNTCRKCI